MKAEDIGTVSYQKKTLFIIIIFKPFKSLKLIKSENQNFILTTLLNSTLESLLVDQKISEISMSTQLQVKDKNTLNWMAKCSVAKTFSLHSNKLEMVSNNTQSASQLGGRENPIYYCPPLQQ